MGVDDLSKIPWFEEPKKKEEVEIMPLKSYTNKEIFINMLRHHYGDILFSLWVGIVSSGVIYAFYQMMGPSFFIFLTVGIITSAGYTAFLWLTRDR